MRPSSTCTTASGTGHGLAHAEGVDSSTRLSSPADAAASAPPQTVTRWPCASFPRRGVGYPFRAFRTESPVTNVAAVTKQCTAPHGMVPIRLSFYSRTWPQCDPLPSFPSPRVLAAPPLSLRALLSKALLCLLLTSSVAATRMLASTGARRHPARVAASSQQHAVAQGVTVLRRSHNRQVRRLLETAVAVDGGGRPLGLQLGVAVRALATTTTPSTSTGTDVPPASPESFLDLNEAPVHPVLSSSSSVSGADASAPARKENSHRFTAKQRRQQPTQQEQSSRDRKRQSKERQSGSQGGSLDQSEHGPTTLRERSGHVQLPAQQQQQPGSSPHKQMRHMHSSGRRGDSPSSAAPFSAGGVSAHGRRGSPPVRRSGPGSASATYVRTAEEEVSTTWSGSAGRRGGDRRKWDRRSGIDTSVPGQPSGPASCAPGTPPQGAPPPSTTYTNTGVPNSAALRRLVKSHHTFRKNYEALRKSDKVAVAFELLCAEAVAHSRLAEHLASALGGDSQAVTTVRLHLTSASAKAAAAGPGGAAVASAKMSTAETLAVLEVPLSVVDWLNEPIVVPELSAETLMEFVHQVLSPSHADKAPVNSCDGAGAGELFAASTGDSPPTPCRYGRLEAIEVWYDAWGRQQHYCEAAAGLPSSGTEPAAPSLKASMALWNRRQRAVQGVLLSHLTEGGRPFALDALPVRSAACDSVDTRDATPVECGPVAAASISGAPAQPDGHVATRPDQFVDGATRELLPYLIEFLQTLSSFKAAREEAKMHAEYRALLENAVAVQSGSVKADAAAAAQGTYTHLCLVARRFRVSPPVALHPPPAAPIPDKPLSGDGGVDEELRTAAQQYLRSISKVDTVASHASQSSSTLEGSAGGAGAHETTGAQSSSLALAERADAAPSYSIAVLDICIGVVLRCLLLYLPALSANDRDHVLQQLSAPWLTLEPEGSGRVACWSAFFGVADFLSKPCTPKRCERISPLPSAMGGLSHGDRSTSSASFSVEHSTLSTLQGVVQQLRSLCWPTVLDRHSCIVQHALCLLPTASDASPSPSPSAASVSHQRQQQRRPPTETLPGGTARGTASSSTVAAAPPHSARPRAPAWSDVIAVVRGSESRQRLGYELLFLFLGTLQCGKESAFPAPVKVSAAADASVAKPVLPHHRAADRRRLNTVCIYALDVDHFIAERMSASWPAGDVWPLLRTQPFSSPGDAASPPGSRPALVGLLAEQTAHPYGLSRVALYTFSDSLLESCAALSFQRAQILMVALQRAVAAPAALTLRSLLPTLHPGTRAGWELSGTHSSATPSHAMQLAARRAEWRAVAPVMSLYTTRACPSLWNTMWVYISSQMKSLPQQVEELMRTAHASAGSEQGGDVAAHGKRRWPNEEVDACYTQLEELATMCAWLVAMVPSVCGKWVAGAGAATSEPAQASAQEHTERVKAGFERCVKGLLAVWTQTGASVDAAEQLLGLFPRYPSATPTPVDCTPVRVADNGAVDATAPGARAPPSAPEETGTGEAVTLLVGLAGAAQTHVWTRVLHGAVELWIKKTRYIQAQSRGIMEAVHLMPPAAASTSAPAAMPSAAPGRAADDRSRTGETVTNGGSDASVPTAPPDMDSALLAWWRSTEEEDIGLPSARVYLAHVYAELLRIVSARAALAPSTPPLERAHVGHPLDFERDSVLGGASDRTGAVTSDGEPMPRWRGDTPVNGAAVTAIFSAAEVAVIVRVLSSIAARGAATVTLGRLTERTSGRGMLGKTSSADPAETVVGVESTSGNGGFIMDSLRRAAVYATAADKGLPSTITPDSTAPKDAGACGHSAATDGDESGNPTRIGVVEEATEHDRGNAAALSAQKAVQRIEEALLSSLTAHSGALPAVTMVEATWLRLLPLSTLQKLLDHRESSATISAKPAAPSRGLSSSAPPYKVANSESSSAQSTARADLAATAATPSPPPFASAAVVASNSAPRLDGSLRESPSPWLRKLHDAVLTSRHSRHVGICLVSSLYSVLAASQKGADSAQPLSEATNCDGSRGAASAASVFCDVTSEAASSCIERCDAARDGPSLATSRLRCFLARLRTSCAEAVVLFHRARRQHTDLAAASGDGDVSSGGGADVDDANPSRVGLSGSPWAAVAEVDGDSNGEAEVGTSHTTAPHQQHGQRFCNVLVVTNELHERLIAYEEMLTCAAARFSGAEQGAGQGTLRTCRDGRTERMRHLLRLLYASLLDVVADFVPYGEHGNAVEVMQMLGVITRRMPWQQCAQESLAQALPAEKDGQFGDHFSDETGTEAVPLAKCGGGVAEAGAAARLSAPRDGDEEGVSIDPLLVCFREQVTRLMPYVDAEVLRCTRARSPQLLSLVLISSAKSSVEYVLRSAPVSSRGSMQRRKGPCTTTAEATCSRSAVALSPVSRSAAKMSASEGASHGTTARAEPGRLGLSTPPLWSQAPLESLLHRIAMDRLMASRHALYLCTLTVNAPEFSTTLLPLTHYLRDARARISWAMLEVVFKAVAMSAVNIQRRHQAEMLLRSDHLLSLSSSPSPGSDQAPGSTASSPADRASSASAVELPRRGGGGDDAPQRGGIALPRSSTDCASLRVGEMKYPRNNGSAASAPLFRTAAVASAVCNAPLQLRHAWGDLARRLLHEEDDVAVSDVSLWVLALYCGAMVNCAGTQVFEQLLACLVFGTTTPAASPATTATRIATLDVVGWTLVLEACGTALDHHYRQAYQSLLRDEFVAFLERAAASAHSDEGDVSASSASSASDPTRPTAAAAGSGRAVLDDALPLTGAWCCGLLEAVPQLFVEDAAFWRRVKNCVESWCAAIALDPAEVASESPSAQRRSTSAVRLSWVTQLQQSFNWAAQCAGHASLVFSDNRRTTETANTDAHAVAQWMRTQLEALGGERSLSDERTGGAAERLPAA